MIEKKSLNPEKLKIVQINTLDIGGGAANSAVNLFQSYRDQGHLSKLVVGNKHSNDPDIIEIPKVTEIEHWTKTSLFLFQKLLPFEGRIRGIGLFRHLLQTFAGGWQRVESELGHEDFNHPGSHQILDLFPQKPDIIHAHNLHGGYFDLRILPRLSQNVPVIINLRDAWLLTGHCAYFFDCERWRIGCGHCPDLSIYPAIKRDATAYNWQKKMAIYKESKLYVTTPSKWLMQKVQYSMVRGSDYRVIPNGVNLNIFHPGDKMAARQELGLPLNHKIVLFVANKRQSKFKDYATIETAVINLANRLDTDLVFVCLGEKGEDQCFGKAHIIYAGYEKEGKRVSLFYQAADVYIHAAKEEAENFPRVIIEALACGVPVVATAVGGIPEQILDGLTGYLVAPGDSTGIAARAEQLLTNEELHASFSTAAAKDAKKRFSLTVQTDTFLDWYQEIIEGSNDSKIRTISNNF